MAKKPSLLDDVLLKATKSRPGSKTWFDRLPKDVQDELNVVKAAFTPVLHQKRSYCKAIIEAASERGWEISGVQGVIAWLGKR